MFLPGLLTNGQGEPPYAKDPPVFVNVSLNSEDVPTRNCSPAAHCSPVTLVIRIVPRQAPATSASVRGVGDNGASLLHAAKNVHSVINAVSRTVAKAVIFNS